MERAAADTKVDVRNNFHPMSILRTQWALKQLAEGETLEVLCKDNRTKEDLLRIISKSPLHKVIGIREEGSYCRIFISRLKARSMFSGIDFVAGHESKKIDRPGGTGIAEQGAFPSTVKKRRKNHE